jgi:HEAT repeat protein
MGVTGLAVHVRLLLDVSVRVLRILGPVADYSCRPKITLALRHRSAPVRLAAVSAIANIADDSCVDELGDVVRKDDSEGNKMAAVRMLVSIGSPKAKAELKQLAKQRNLPAVQQAINSALDKLMQ